MSNKYGAHRTWSELCRRWFDSKAECLHGEGLHLLELDGQISDLSYQDTFYLAEDPRVTIRIDFHYRQNGMRIFEDVKGVLTRDFRTKLAWLKQKEGIEVVLIR